MPMRRMTRQRKAVLEVLQNTRNHPDAAWIYQEVKKMVPSISLGTVYRTLDALVKEGKIQALHTGGATRYDAYTDPHPHLFCTRCGAVVDLTLELPHLLEKAQAQNPKVKIESVRLTFEGLCPSCAAGGLEG